MSKEFLLFEKEEINFFTKFMKLQDLLVTNKSTSKLECIILFTIFYIQTISGFFAANLGVLDIKNSSSDGYLNYLNKILRIKDLFLEDYASFKIVLIFLLIFMISATVYYFYVLSKIEKDSFYSLREQILNVILKIFLFVLFKPILDLSLANVCFEETNPNFSNVSCVVADNPGIFAIGIILFFYSSFLSFFINLFYNDAQFLLQNSYFSRMHCGYEMYITLNHIIYAILLSQGTYLGKELFIVYNLFVSVILLKFYFEKYLFYDSTVNVIAGIFHTVYAWTSGYFFIFNFIEISEKGVIYVLGMLIICYLYYNIKEKLEDYIVLNVPFHKLTNKFHILFYIKTLMQKINNIDSNLEDKAKMIGIIQTHVLECPQADCESKHKSKQIYLPLAEEWTDRSKPEISDRVFLLNFLLMVMNFYIKENNYSADFMINRSLYYLTIIGNNCKAMLYYNKVKEMNLTMQERFAHLRLYFQISKSLVSNLKSSREGCLVLDDLNVTLYFKYEDLSQKFFDEINNDISLSLEFWKNLKQHHETSRVIDFNKIFELTDKIRIAKSKIEKIWSDIFNTYSGVNDLFDLYENYIEQINDDDLQKRELDSLKNKNVLSSEHIQVNYYNLLFNKNTGIIIANGHKYKEGIIEKANDEIERIFEYKADELKGMNVTKMIPRAVAKNHRLFMERYYEIGEKRVIDRQLRTFAKDKDNCIIPIQLYVKLFPMLADYAFFVGLIFKENMDDVIITDKKFNIQCCSRKLMEKMELSNKLMFQDHDIPFYVLCKKFVNFFKVFLKKYKKKEIDVSQINYNENFNKEDEEEIEDYEINEDMEVPENTELEYELRVPQFLLDYSASPSSKKDNTLDFTMDKSVDASNNDNSFFNTTNNITQIADENENLVENEKGENNKNEKNNNDNHGKTKGNNGTEKEKNAKKSNFGLDKQQDEEREFYNKINHFRSLFEYGKFQDLQDLIERTAKDSSNKEYKFNFSFQPYKFGENDTLYIIRCIDNKSEFEDGGSSGDAQNNEALEQNNNNNNNLNNLNNNLLINKLKSNQENMQDENSNKNFMQNHMRQKLAALKRLFEATHEERREILDKAQNYLKTSEDKSLLKTQFHFIEEIASFSKIFGQKKDDQCNLTYL